MARESGDWFDDNAPETSGGGPPAGGSAYDRIRAIYRQMGYEPSDAEVRQWGADIDDRYLAKIRTEISRAHGNTGPPLGNTGQPAAGAYNLEQLKSALMAQTGKATPEELAKFVAAHPEFATGVTIQGSKKNKLYDPSGKFLADVIRATSGPNPSWDWDASTGSPAAPAGGTLLDPWTAQFQYPSFEPPPAFQAPTGEEAFNDQGFKYTLARGQEALERSKAAQGSLLTTGMLKELQERNVGLHAQRYDDVYRRRLGEYQLQGGTERGDYQADYNKALGEYRQGYDIFAANQDRPFNKLSTLAGMGQTASNSLLSSGQGYAGMYGNTLLGNAGTLGNLGIQGANAQAGANMYGAGAYGNALGSLGSLGAYYAGLYQRPPQQPGPWSSGYVYGG
jgi:hypothetical protein